MISHFPLYKVCVYETNGPPKATEPFGASVHAGALGPRGQVTDAKTEVRDRRPRVRKPSV